MKALIGIETGILRGIEILKKSLDIISDFAEIYVVSSVIRSSQQEQNKYDDYFSIVLKIACTEEPEVLLERLAHIEQYFLREYFSKHYRTVLLIYADKMSLVPHLVLPHPQLVQNKVFLIGSVEIWASYIHPILEKPLSDLLKEVDLRGVEFISPGKSLITPRDIQL